MPSPMIQVGAQLLCPHGGTITLIPAGVSVQSDGQPVASTSATGVVAGCTNTVASLGQVPCTTVTWTMGAVQVTLGGVPALLSTSLAVFNCSPPLPPLPATVIQTQNHATAT